MVEFNGKKFRPTGNQVQAGYDVWGCRPIYKEEFKMTSSYMKYLAEKEQERKRLELQALKSKLEYQMKTYGEVDDIDYNNYMALLSSYNNQIIQTRNNPKATVKLNQKSMEVIGSYNNRLR